MNERNPLFQFVLLWASLLMSQGMIVLVSQTAMNGGAIAPDGQPPASGLGEMNPTIFGGVAVLIAAVAFMLPRFMLGQAKTRVAPDADLREVTKVVLPIWLVRWALIEAVTLMGFVASMLSSKPTLIYPFAAVGLVGFVLTFPTEQKIRNF